MLLFLAVTKESSQAVHSAAQPLPPGVGAECASELGPELLASLAQEMREARALPMVSAPAHNRMHVDTGNVSVSFCSKGRVGLERRCAAVKTCVVVED